jgi:hypothetical protein
MNIPRMFAFLAAVLITAVIFRVIADGLADRQEPGIAAESISTDSRQATAE